MDFSNILICLIIKLLPYCPSHLIPYILDYFENTDCIKNLPIEVTVSWFCYCQKKFSKPTISWYDAIKSSSKYLDTTSNSAESFHHELNSFIKMGTKSKDFLIILQMTQRFMYSKYGTYELLFREGGKNMTTAETFQNYYRKKNFCTTLANLQTEQTFSDTIIMKVVELLKNFYET